METPSSATEKEFWISSPRSWTELIRSVAGSTVPTRPWRVTHQMRPFQSGITEVTGSQVPLGHRLVQVTQSCGTCPVRSQSSSTVNFQLPSGFWEWARRRMCWRESASTARSWWSR